MVSNKIYYDHFKQRCVASRLETLLIIKARTTRRARSNRRSWPKGHREQEQHIRQLEQEVAHCRAEVLHAQQELHTRNELLARYEFGEAARRDEDKRIGLFRQAAQAWRAGQDPEPFLETIRQIEQVLMLSNEDQQRAVNLLDRHLNSIATSLQEVYKVAGLIEDPKRFRPKFIGSSAYKFKTLAWDNCRLVAMPHVICTY